MNHQNEFEKVMQSLVNDNYEEAQELMHNIVVEKSRAEFERLEEEEPAVIGGDPRDQYASDISADMGELDAEETYNDAEIDGVDPEGDEEYDSEEEDIDSRLMDLEAAFAELQDEFEKIAGDDEDMDYDSEEYDSEEDMDDEEGDEEDLDMDDDDEDLEEAFAFLDDVPQTGQGNEDGSHIGAGRNEKASIQKKSTYTDTVKRDSFGGEATEFGDMQNGEKGKKLGNPKDHTPSSNVDADHKKAPEAKKRPNQTDGEGNTVSPMRPRDKQKKS